MINYFAILRLNFLRDNQTSYENLENCFRNGTTRAFRKKQILKIGQVVLILVHFEVGSFWTQPIPICFIDFQDFSIIILNSFKNCLNIEIYG